MVYFEVAIWRNIGRGRDTEMSYGVFRGCYMEKYR